MLTFIIISILFSFISSSMIPFTLLSVLILIFSSSSVNLQPVVLQDGLILDEVSYLMCYMTVFVVYISYIFSPRTISSSLSIVLMLICCLGVFCSSSVLSLYFFYEASLVPILYIILKWGSYPERSMGSIMLLIYTAVFTLPFLYVIAFFWLTYKTTSIMNMPTTHSPLLALIVFLCFCVKLPIYGVHLWLPMAHVEAPTFGSMLLAGVLLKLGGVGLMRLLPLFSVNLSFMVLGYCLICIPIVTWVCCFQSDMKRLVAYSSVSHMMCMVPLVSLMTSSSHHACLLIMLFHGISSPLLFMLVGVTYSFYSSRQLILVRGLLTSSPLLSFTAVVAFLFNLSAPPFPSFVSEVLFISASLHLTDLFILSIFAFCFTSLVYNTNWMTSLLFSSSSSCRTTPLYYSEFMPIVLSCLSSVYLVVILCCI